MLLHPKIQERKKAEQPISYRSIAIKERSSNLDKRIVEGYGVIWGSKNDYGEKFLKGCFAKSIQDIGPDSNSAYKIKFRDQHGKACSLFEVLKEDEIGLYFRTVPLDAVQWCDDLLVQIRSGTINNFSIGFRPVWDKAEYDETDDCIIFSETKIFEISAVSIPSDMETFAIRSAEEIENTSIEIEQFCNSLKSEKQLVARKLFARCMTLVNQEPQVEIRQALKDAKPSKTGLDYDYLISKILNK